MTALNIVLFEPEIPPPNTGNIICLCSNAGLKLHLIHPLGFQLDERSVRRAGMDYRDLARIQEYSDWEDFLKQHRCILSRSLSTQSPFNTTRTQLAASLIECQIRLHCML